jgi:hypothetical protein
VARLYSRNSSRPAFGHVPEVFHRRRNLVAGYYLKKRSEFTKDALRSGSAADGDSRIDNHVAGPLTKLAMTIRFLHLETT